MSQTALQKQLAAIGRKGGAARAKVLSKQRREEIARMGGKAPRKSKSKTAAIVLLLASLASPLHAQTWMTCQQTVVGCTDCNVTTCSESTLNATGAIQINPIQLKTHSPRLDWPSLIAAAATSSADTLSTIHALNTGACHESNPLLGRQPSQSALWVSTALSVTGLIALNYTAKHMMDHGKAFQRISRGINWGIAGLEGSVTIYNLHICS